MLSQHVLDCQAMVCRLCGASYDAIVDGRVSTCIPIGILGQERCVECSLLRQCYMTRNGATCGECIENIRKDGVALGAKPNNLCEASLEELCTDIVKKRGEALQKSLAQIFIEAYNDVDWDKVFKQD